MEHFMLYDETRSLCCGDCCLAECVAFDWVHFQCLEINMPSRWSLRHEGQVCDLIGWFFRKSFFLFSLFVQAGNHLVRRNICISCAWLGAKYVWVWTMCDSFYLTVSLGNLYQILISTSSTGFKLASKISLHLFFDGHFSYSLSLAKMQCSVT